MGDGKEFQSLTNLQIICNNEHFSDIKFAYVGGIWVSLEFKSVKAMEQFHNHIGSRSWFSKLHPWSNNFILNEMVVWIDVEGVVIITCTYKTYSQITMKWGNILYMEKSFEDNLYS